MKPSQVYKLVPKLDCKGLCAESCGPIGMTQAEFDALEQPDLPHMMSDGLVFIPPLTVGMTEMPTCPLLANGRCSAYARRPLICRLWGVVASMPCPHGCKPARVLKDAEGRVLLQMVERG